MKMSGRVTSCCVALFFALTSVSAVQRLRSINALKKINYGQSVPEHSLVLLYWFANTVEIDNNNVIRLTFDPIFGDYGSHHYGNYEELLDPLPQGNRYQYYTIGNLNHETSTPLPPYVVHPPIEDVGGNRDRIIIRVREQNIGQALQIDQVYITQHYDTSEHQGTPYDPDHTYRITTNLLTEIREFSGGENQQQLLRLRNLYGSNADVSDIRNTWGDLACLGLLLYIVIQEKHSSNKHNRHESKRNNSASKSHVSRNFQNQGYVTVNMNDDEDHKSRRTTGNRVSGTSVPCRWICCICCIVTICLIVGLYIYIIRKK